MDTVRCRHCNRVNRTPAAGSGSPLCGNCHRPLPWIVDAGDHDFGQVAERASIPVVVDLWAPWCAPCRRVSPVLERLAEERAGEIKLVKVNVDDAPALTQRFAVRAVPTLLILDQGNVIAAKAGAAPAFALRSWLDHALARTTSTPAQEQPTEKQETPT
ncbi:MAG: thioredoxin family protein [Pseudonocardia sp.]|nr:thioredoxin family protein [Pseudonocardia sp.]